MKKNSAFKLRSGNKPSIAQLSGVSPVKLSQFQKDVQARKARKRAELKAKRAEAKASGKPKESSKIKQDVSSVFGQLDKAIQGFFNNPRSTAAGGDKKTYEPPKQGIASNPSSTPPPPNNGYKKIKGESRYSYKKNTTTGGYDFIDHQNNDKKGTIKPTNKKAMDHLNSSFPMKKKSSVKMKKKK